VDQGILPFVFEAAVQPMDLTAFAGLALVSETMLALGLDEVVRERLQLRERQRGYDEFDKVHALVLVQAAGGDCVEDVRILARDAGLGRLLARPLPSPDALHDFLGAFHDEAQFASRPAAGVAWIPEETGELEALAAVNTVLVRRAASQTPVRRATLDLDATIIESHKRDALVHYKGGRGYQPTAVVWAEQDLVLADQYRDGNVPAGMDTLAVARAGGRSGAADGPRPGLPGRQRLLRRGPAQVPGARKDRLHDFGGYVAGVAESLRRLGRRLGPPRGPRHRDGPGRGGGVHAGRLAEAGAAAAVCGPRDPP